MLIFFIYIVLPNLKSNDNKYELYLSGILELLQMGMDTTNMSSWINAHSLVIGLGEADIYGSGELALSLVLL